MLRVCLQLAKCHKSIPAVVGSAACAGNISQSICSISPQSLSRLAPIPSTVYNSWMNNQSASFSSSPTSPPSPSQPLSSSSLSTLEQLITHLTPEQKLFVLETDAHKLLLLNSNQANLGASHALCTRILRLLLTPSPPIDPNSILILSPLEASRQTLEEALNLHLPLTYPDLQISTFARLALSALRNHFSQHPSSNINPRFRVLSHRERSLFLRRHLYDLPLTADRYRPMQDPTRYVKGLVDYFDYLQTCSVSPEQYESIILELEAAEAQTLISGELEATAKPAKKSRKKSKQEPEFAGAENSSFKQWIEQHKELSRTYSALWKLKIENSVFDFTGVQFLFNQLLSNSTSPATIEFASKYKYVFVDDAEDLTPLQIHILKNLSLLNNSLQLNVALCPDVSLIASTPRSSHLSSALPHLLNGPTAPWNALSSPDFCSSTKSFSLSSPSPSPSSSIRLLSSDDLYEYGIRFKSALGEDSDLSIREAAKHLKTHFSIPSPPSSSPSSPPPVRSSPSPTRFQHFLFKNDQKEMDGISDYISVLLDDLSLTSGHSLVGRPKSKQEGGSATPLSSSYLPMFTSDYKIAVLASTRSQARHFQQMLKQRGMESDCEISESLDVRPEIRAITCLLTYVSIAKEDITQHAAIEAPLYDVLCHPLLFGFPPEELARLSIEASTISALDSASLTSSSIPLMETLRMAADNRLVSASPLLCSLAEIALRELSAAVSESSLAQPPSELASRLISKFGIVAQQGPGPFTYRFLLSRAQEQGDGSSSVTASIIRRHSAAIVVEEGEIWVDDRSDHFYEHEEEEERDESGFASALPTSSVFDTYTSESEMELARRNVDAFIRLIHTLESLPRSSSASGTRLREVMDEISNMGDLGHSSISDDAGPSPSPVLVTTLRKAKGRAFDIVFVPSASDDQIPGAARRKKHDLPPLLPSSSSSASSFPLLGSASPQFQQFLSLIGISPSITTPRDAHVEAERRLWYSTLHRARTEFISSSFTQHSHHGHGGHHGHQHQRKLTRFIEECAVAQIPLPPPPSAAAAAVPVVEKPKRTRARKAAVESAASSISVDSSLSYSPLDLSPPPSPPPPPPPAAAATTPEPAVKPKAKKLAAEQFDPMSPEVLCKISLSASKLNDYISCPLRFKFAHVLKRPQAPNVYFMAGSCVHETIAFIANHRKEHGEVPEWDAVVETFNKHWHPSFFGPMYYPSNEKRAQDMKQANLEHVRGFYEREDENFESIPVHIERPFALKFSFDGIKQEDVDEAGKVEWSDMISVEEIHFTPLTPSAANASSSESSSNGDTAPFPVIVLPDSGREDKRLADVLVRGIFDRIDQTSDGETHIIEYKSRLTDRELKIRVKDNVQLLLYAFAYEQLFKERPAKAILTSVAGGGSAEFVPSEDGHRKIKQLVLRTALSIRNAHFDAKPSKFGCSMCPFRTSCEHSMSTRK